MWRISEIEEPDKRYPTGEWLDRFLAFPVHSELKATEQTPLKTDVGQGHHQILYWPRGKERSTHTPTCKSRTQNCQ